MKNDLNNYRIKLIRSSKGEGAVILPIIKSRYAPDDYYDTIKIIKHMRNYKGYFFDELFPNDIDQIITCDWIPLAFGKDNICEEKVVNEILFFISFLKNFNDELANFQSLRASFEHSLLLGKYADALETLSKIKGNFGYSFWMIESNLLLLNFSDNVVNLTRSYQQYKISCHDDYIKTFIRTIRRKTNFVEKASEAQAFITDKLKKLEEDGIESYKHLYLKFCNYHVEDDWSLNNIYELLEMASRLNLIDMFLLIDKILIYVTTQKTISKENKNKIIQFISDSKLPFSCKKSCDLILQKFDKEDEITHQVYRLKESLCKRHNNSQTNSFRKLIEKFPSNFEILFDFAKMEVLNKPISENLIYNSKEDGLLDLIIFLIKNSLLKEGDYKHSTEILDKAMRLHLALSSTTLSYGFSNFYYDTISYEHSQRVSYCMSCNFYNRDILEYFKEYISTPLLDEFLQCFGNYESIWYRNAQHHDFLSYDDTSIKLLEFDDSSCDLESKLKLLHKNLTPENIILFNRCSEKLLYRYLQNNNVVEAIKLFVNLQFISKLKVCGVDCQKINEQLFISNLRLLNYDLDFCIYAHLTDYKGAKGSKWNTEVIKTLSYVLRTNGLSKPSELSLPLDASDLEKAKYAYIFRHICDTDLLMFIMSNIKDKDKCLEGSIITNNVLHERISLLEIALELDSEDEKEQINSQIQNAKDEILRIEQIKLKEFLVSSAKIIKETVSISDLEIILPFYESMRSILIHYPETKFNNYLSGEYLLFREYFVKYKKAYIKNLSDQIGVYIRHGFFKNEILDYFLKHQLCLKACPEIDDDTMSSHDLLEYLDKCLKYPITEFQRNHIVEIVSFSKEIYSFIANTIDNMFIYPISCDIGATNFIFFEDQEISSLAQKLSRISNPYEFKYTLDNLMSELIRGNLKKLGKFVGNSIKTECPKLLAGCFSGWMTQDDPLFKKLSEAKNNIADIANTIEKWFDFITDNDKNYSIKMYFDSVQKEHPCIKRCSLDVSNTARISRIQLHTLNLIIANLIVNAKEHSGFKEKELEIEMDIYFKYNKLKLDFSNNLASSCNVNSIINKMKSIEENSKTVPNEITNERGNGYNGIALSLNKIVGTNWELNFHPEKLPTNFSLTYDITWR